MLVDAHISFGGKGTAVSSVGLYPDQIQDLQHWFTTDTVTLESGTEEGVRKIQSATCSGAIGGTMTQDTTADRGWLVTYPNHTAFFTTSQQHLESNQTAATFNFLHDLSSSTLAVRFRTASGLQTTRCIFATCSGANSTRGIFISYDGVNKTVTVKICNGSGSNFTVNSTFAALDSTAYSLVIRKAVNSAQIDWDITLNGVVVDYGTSTNAPASGNASSILTIGSVPGGSSTLGFRGMIGATASYNRRLSDSEIADLHTHFKYRVSLAYSFDDVFLYGPTTFGIVEWWDTADARVDDNGYVDKIPGKYGLYTLTVQGTNSTAAMTIETIHGSFRNRPTLSITQGETVENRGVRLQLPTALMLMITSAQDTPFSVACNIDTRSDGDMCVFGIGNSSGGGSNDPRLLFQTAYVSFMNAAERDDSGNTASVVSTVSGEREHNSICYTIHGTQISGYRDRTVFFNQDAFDGGPMTNATSASFFSCDRGAMGAVNPYDGYSSWQMFLRRSLNIGDWEALLSAVYPMFTNNYLV